MKDAYATENTQPIQDSVQNLVLIDAAELDGYTIIKFKRKFITGDSQNDIDITVFKIFVCIVSFYFKH